MDFRKLLENKMFMILMGTIVGIIVIIIIIVVIVSMSGGSVSSFSALEERLVSAAKEYYQEEGNASKLPQQVGQSVEVSTDTLTEEGYLKEMEKLSPKGSSCSGRVVVKNGNGNLLYQAFVDCGEDYQTESLSSHILSNEDRVTSGEGLYEVNGKYVYRGEDPDNYITFAKQTYRIVQVNADKSIDIIATSDRKRVVWDDRYNQEVGKSDGINDYSVSRVRDTLMEYINSEAFQDADRLLLEPFVVCAGKVASDAPYTLDQECSSPVMGQMIALLPVTSYAYASIDSLCRTVYDGNCQNYNYLSSYDSNWWTVTGNTAGSNLVYQISSGAYVDSVRASMKASPREVIRISSQAVYVSGDGSSASPYVIK